MIGEVSTRDVREGKVAAKLLRGGIEVPPGLQTNALTLREHQDYLRYSGHRALTRAEAELIGHRADEIDPAITVARPARPTPVPEILPPPSAPPEPKRPPSPTERLTLAQMYGYEGEACRNCGNFTLVRAGTCLCCNTCGMTTGCS